MNTKEKCVVLCVPLNGTGHINASISLCLALLKKGHKIVFFLERKLKGTVLRYGFEEELYENETEGDQKSEDHFQQIISTLTTNFRRPADEQTEYQQFGYKILIDVIKGMDSIIANLINKVKPDVIIRDNYIDTPAIVNSNIPYIALYSANPLFFIRSEQLPPPKFGLPLNDRSDWQRCEQIKINTLREIWEDYNKWVIECGAPALVANEFHYTSKYLNILMYPKCLFEDYAVRSNLGSEWMLMEHAVVERDEDFKIPDEFLNKSGKLIYIGLGTAVTFDVELMKKLVAVFSKSSHKFIVSKGLLHNEYELAENMYGQCYLPQLKILQICDLFITHGGNNSFTEALYFGVPMIVMPMFGDQFDNAQRLVEKELGAQINPFEATEEELLSTVDALLRNDTLRQKMKQISQEMKASSSVIDVATRIEEIALEKREIRSEDK